MKKLIMVIMLGMSVVGHTKCLSFSELNSKTTVEYQTYIDSMQGVGHNAVCLKGYLDEHNDSGYKTPKLNYLVSSFETGGYTSKTYLEGNTYTTVTKSCYSCSESISTYTTY